ncbi:MAG: type IV toxin-antitoxin system AbiEi family antitoxin domain-containing protein [Gammaproteobacteria bacterium]|nr:type IV toxin-antitoxin system AbiEi family antitoxin domain-containing protein [Gammaproteobacteria bacterium]
MAGSDAVLKYITKRGNAGVADFARLGLSRPVLFRTLAELVEQGRIVRVRRGVYQLATVRDASDSWVQVMHRYPQGVLCLLSALAFHEITTQSPSVVWLALPKSAWRKPEDYPPLRIVHFSGAAYTTRIETHARAGGAVRVYSMAKTVADCFKFRNHIGLDVAIEALREGWQQRRFTLDELDKMARVCRVQAVLRPYVEALVA